MSTMNSWCNLFDVFGEPAGGGNADVFFVKNKDTGEELALKELRYRKVKKKKHGKSRCIKQYKNGEIQKRFINEIHIAKKYCNIIPGIIPIIDSNKKEYWYTMPIAEPIMRHIADKDIDEIVLGVKQLAETLEKLHSEGISHRDIKPANIYFYNDHFSFGDFGLVDFPDNLDSLTRSDKGLGAVFTIAPEMKRNPKAADGTKADVFSLAKTLWMFLSRDEKGFDGVYNWLDSSHSLRSIGQYKEKHLVELDELLRDATANDPNLRPTISEFKRRLEEWQMISADAEKAQTSDWAFLNKQLFGANAPDSCVWVDSAKIVNVLNIIGLSPAFNHMLFSDTGGLDFSYAKEASESSFIKIYDTIGYCHLLKPKKLFFEGFGDNSRWNYFLLELETIDPFLAYPEYVAYEYLVEDYPGHYVSAQYANYGVYDYESGQKFPEGAEIVYRYVNGKFLFVMKTGPYNAMNGSYDGKHGACSADKFREYMESLVEAFTECYSYVKGNDELKNLSIREIEKRFATIPSISKNPFKATVRDDEDVAKLLEQYNSKEECDTYINNNYSSWNFRDILTADESNETTAIKFAFCFKSPDNSFSFENFFDDSNYLTVNGGIKQFGSETNENCFVVYDRDLAISTLSKLEQSVSEKLIEKGFEPLEKFNTCFSIKIVRVGKPAHLFSKDEIHDLMATADDRVHNQLVIDENGYARIIQDISHGYLYPVRLESWCAGNNYVGKYSSLSTLDTVYISSLQGWLSYLKTGKRQYIDYVRENQDIKKLLEEIDAYYL